MKILKIFIKNINSLRGEHSIDFESEPLASAGIFAITGPTGSGKTSILDAITLALYNQVARGAENTTVISHGEHEALAMVDFRIKYKKYRCIWNLYRAAGKPDGKIQPVKWSVSDITENEAGNILASGKVTEVAKTMLEITEGLDKDKFLKSVMLAQGNFAAFLTADKKEKGELLSKITGFGDFKELSMAAYEKHKTLDSELKMLKDTAKTAELPNPEQTEQLRQQEAELENENKKLTLLIAETAEIKRRREEWAEKSETLKLLKTRLDTAIEDKNNLRETEAKLQLHEQTLAYAADMGRLQVLEEEITNTTLIIKELDRQLPLLKKQKEEAEARLQSLEKDLQRTEEEWKTAEPLRKAAAELDGELKRIIEKYKSWEIDYKELLKKAELLTAELERMTGELTAKKTAKLVLDNWLDKNSAKKTAETVKAKTEAELSKYFNAEKGIQSIDKEVIKQKNTIAEIDHLLKNLTGELTASEAKTAELLKEKAEAEQQITGDVSVLEKRPAELSAQEIAVKEMLQLSRHFTDTGKVMSDKQLKLKELTKSKIELEKDKLTLEEKLRLQQNIIELLEKQAKQQLLIKKLEAHRADLEPGVPCPLCGSEHHPFVTEVSEKESDEQKLETEKKAYGLMMSRLHSLIEKIPLQATLDDKAEEIQTLEQQLEAGKKRFEKLRTEVKNPELNIESTGLIEELLKKITGEKSTADELMQTYRRQLVLLQNLNSELNALAIAASTLRGNINTGNAEKKSAEKKLKELTVQLEDNKNVMAGAFNKIKELCAGIGEDVSVQTLQHLLTRLETAGKEYAQNLERSYIAEKEILSLENNISGHEIQLRGLQAKEIKNKKEELDALTQTGKKKREKRKEFFGGTALDELEQDHQLKLTGLRSEIKSAQESEKTTGEHYRQKVQALTAGTNRLEECKKIVAELNHDVLLRASGVFPDIASIKAARIPEEEYRALKLNIDTINQNITKLNAEYQTIENQLDKLTEALVSHPGYDEISESLNILTLEREKRQHELTETKIRLHNYKAKAEDHRRLLEQIDIKKEEIKPWAMLNDLIGQSDGQKFNNYAQCITLHHLVQRANEHLQLLSGRYLIIHDRKNIDFNKEKEDFLKMSILDTYRANNVRAMQTLSGGETFLVSLALALGLSDMAGKNNPVESLFIDEGFGTLDPEALDTALSALECLQTRGKTIGIISHVEQLKDRIPVQIQVIPQSPGSSKIVTRVA